MGPAATRSKSVAISVTEGLLPLEGATRHIVQGGHADPPVHWADASAASNAAASPNARALTARPPRSW